MHGHWYHRKVQVTWCLSETNTDSRGSSNLHFQSFLLVISNDMVDQTISGMKETFLFLL